MALDNFSIFFTFLFVGVSGAVILASLDYVERFGPRQGEFYALVLIATSGMMLLAGARDLVTIFVALELTSITQYILAGFMRDDKGSEAALKYLLLGAVVVGRHPVRHGVPLRHLRHDAPRSAPTARRASPRRSPAATAASARR